MRGAEEGGDADLAAARARADRQATDWLIALQDAPEDQDTRGRFDAWRRESLLHAAAWNETRRVADLVAKVGETGSGRRAPSSLATSGSERRRLVARPIAIAAAAACLVVVGAPELLLRVRADRVAAMGQVETVRLNDGSLVRLGSGSAVAVNYDKRARDVELLRGDAFFEVRHDPARPFRVTAGGAVATDIGTAFEVGLHGDRASVAVRDGLVRFDSKVGEATASQRLGPGDTATADRTGRTTRGAVERGDVAGWMRGRLIANDRPLREVIDELRPWYSGVILLRGAGFDSERITGVYDLHDPVGALQAIARAHDGSVMRISPWVLVLSSA